MVIFFPRFLYRIFLLIFVGFLPILQLLAEKKYIPGRTIFKSNYYLNRFDTIPSIGNYNYYVSDRGLDSNDGRSPTTPRRSLNSIETLISATGSQAPMLSLGLEENSVFREELDPVNNNLQVSTYGLKVPKRLAKITGMDPVKEWSATPATNNVYQYLLNHAIDISNPGYTYVIIAEIDTAMEKTRPIAAVKYLTFVADLESCKNQPGTYYTPPITTNPVLIYMHPTEGGPGKNKFRYEVASRNSDINGFYIDNASYQNLFLQTSSYGFGMLSGGKNTTVRNVIFQGGGIHHTVLRSGTIDSCLFLAGPKGLKDELAAVFYNAEGKDGNNKVSNTIFMDVPNAVYSHTDGVVNHKSMVLDKVYAFADSTDAGNGLSAGDTDSIDVSNCYVENYPTGWYGGGLKVSIRNSLFRNTNQSAINLLTKTGFTGQATISNVLIKTNANDNNQNLNNGWTAYAIRSPYGNVNIDVSNIIVHGYSTWHDPSGTVTTFQFSGTMKAYHNIYICDVNDNNSMHIYRADNSSGKGSSTDVSSDYNAYILVRGSRFHWIVTPNNNSDLNIVTLSEWQALTGQDKNSIFIDLRNNPLGLKAIFTDPLNGNWTLSQTPQADSIRKISAGMLTPPLFYPKRPIIENDGIPYKAPGGFSSFTGVLQSETQSEVQWQTFNESGFLSFVIESSTDGINFLPAGTVKAYDNNGNNNYQYLDTHQGTDSIFYRLRCYYIDSTNILSPVIKLTGKFSQELKILMYPNPFQQDITIIHPRRDVGEIMIYDYLGKLIKITSIPFRIGKTQLSLADLPAGRYFVRWTSNKETLTGTVIK